MVDTAQSMSRVRPMHQLGQAITPRALDRIPLRSHPRRCTHPRELQALLHRVTGKPVEDGARER